MTNDSAIFAPLLEVLETRYLPATMTAVITEHAFGAEALDTLFEKTAERQYTRKILFSTMVQVMLLIVTGKHQSVHQAFKRTTLAIGASIKALYDKLARVEPGVSEALVKHIGARCSSLIDAMSGARLPSPLGEIDLGILDGNHIASTEHRLLPTRGTKAGVLPATTVVMLDPQQMIVREIIGELDAYASEIAQSERLWNALKPGQCVLADRLYCTRKLIEGWMDRGVYVLLRESPHFVFDGAEERKLISESTEGQVYEQRVWWGAENKRRFVRRVEIVLNQPTVDGDRSIFLICTVPNHIAAPTLASTYRTRWTIEKMFAQLEKCFASEMPSLPRPSAALFVFSVGCCAWNVLSTLKASLRAAHPTVDVEDTVSVYQVTCAISQDWSAVELAAIILHLSQWKSASSADVARELLRLATRFSFKTYAKAKRGPKKPPKPKTDYRGYPHLSTQRLLDQQKSLRAKNGSINKS